MDDKNKTQTQTQYQQPQQSQTGAGDAQGVGSLVKEHGPVATGDLRPSRIEPEIHHELKKIGVESVPEFPEVKPEDQRIGISPAGEAVPVPTAPTGLVKIPMVEEEARQELKHEKPTNSNWGRLALLVKFFKKIHSKLLTSRN